MPRSSSNTLSSQQGRYWILTIPSHEFTPYLPPGIQWIRGQLEVGDGGFKHWQLALSTCDKTRGTTLKRTFGSSAHIELTRSKAAEEYVWKEETRVQGTQFELGQRKLRRNNAVDWDSVRRSAISGDFDSIPSDIYVRCYNQLRRISTDHLRPIAMERNCTVLWGRTGTGKSRSAWDAAGHESYPKTPTTKFWDGYRGEEHVVIDEFRGAIEISHLLRWLDRYPCIVEVKGGATVLRATHIWITSNLDPRLWYPTIDQETLDALLRRLTITHFP